jgi:glycolate oxidase FAD binding subunit
MRLPFFTQPPGPDMALWRFSVAQTAPALDLPYAQLVEWHGGLRWLWAPAAANSSVAARLHEAAAKAQGTTSIFIANYSIESGTSGHFDHQKGQMEGFTPPFSPALAGIHRRLKAEFDPANIFNRNRLLQAA